MNVKRSVRTLIQTVLTASLVASVFAPQVAMAADYVPVSGAGSSWSANAVDQWRRNVQQYGMRVNFASTGSVDGRNQFKGGTVDYAVSETPYGLTDNGVVDALPTRPFAYMPIVAGGTAFMYNLNAGGKQITNLRLSGEVLTKIFTGVITKWNDAAIAADNPSLTLPNRQIVPVVRSDGSGSTAQFTLWMSKQHTTLWNKYCQATGRSTPCGLTSFYPTKAGAGFVAQPNSQGVSGYVAQKANEGTITYVEYSYALKTGFPVVKLLNNAGYYVEPTASNVAVALMGATINEKPGASYLTQQLTGVYNSTDKRAYPMSSYSYMIIPTSAQGAFTTAKGKTLAAFANYFLCEGQQQAEVLGYSPLPINLVEAGLKQVNLIPGADTASIDIKKCNNPTFSADGSNTLAKNAPMPSECDKKGATSQCAEGTGGAGAASSGGTGTGTGTDSGTTVDGSTTTGTGTGSGTSVGGVAGGISGPTVCDVETGTCTTLAAVPTETSGAGWGTINWVILAIILVVLAAIFGPPLAVVAASRRQAGTN